MKKVEFTETILRDANQSLIATRLPYEKFAPMLAEAIKNVHRGSVHLGKRPQSVPQDGRAALEAELDNRRHELDALVKREEYEEAAVCRDRINQLKTQLEGLATGEVGND